MTCIYIEIQIPYSGFATCYRSIRKLSKTYVASPRITSYTCRSVYNYLKLKSLNKKREEGKPKAIDFFISSDEEVWTYRWPQNAMIKEAPATEELTA